MPLIGPVVIESKWLNFVKQEVAAGRKTLIYHVETKNGTSLGSVAWYSQWRKYCFFPVEDTLYDPECLNDIAKFVQSMTDMHRLKGGEQ